MTVDAAAPAPVRTDAALAVAALEGDAVAALELFSRFGGLVHKLAARFGTQHTYDYDDARQDCFLALLEAADDVRHDGREFGLAFNNRATQNLKRESSAARPGLTLPFHTFQRVYNAVRRFDYNLPAARDYLANEAPLGERVDPNTFTDVWFAAFGVTLEWNDSAALDGEGATVAETVADRTAETRLRSVEDLDAAEQLLGTLSPQWREVLERTYGLGGYEPQDATVIAAAMGMHRAAIRKIRSKALARLQISSDLPAHYTPTERGRTPLRSTVHQAESRRPSRRDFPVTTRRIER
ncbi:RNA polymerase sigma factor [Prauserella muralis]|uniref:Uncharacterized protein n=1 Tax=Prauserella muralis TaxID=588067 RepID=A0A2V4AKQ4_9PSEU|nr:sigma factor-like helix-turn-helix DNA-binding protein [Prauserella muralis]PXY20855.1 hypothetical protein BAY60_25460 [Prauserella muralis]TWE29892.1 RNA polymerase sigma factor (sigma-70 family) [Prauserella muralis]